MAFFEIDGTPIGIQTGNASEEPELMGDKAVMFDGSLRSTYKTQKRRWPNLISEPLEEAAANTIRAKNGTFVTITGDCIPEASMEALLTITNAQYIDRNGVDFVRFLTMTIEEQ